MMPPRFDQVVACRFAEDPVWVEARRTRSVARTLGLESEVFVSPESAVPASAGKCVPLGDYQGGASDTVLYHYCGRSPALAVVAASPARRILRYRGVQSSAPFAPFDPVAADHLAEARVGLREALGAVHCVWADCDCNAAYAIERGHRHVRVLPPFFTLHDFAVTPAKGHGEKSGGAGKTILFSGAMAPGDRLEDLLLAFAWYHHGIEPSSRLLLVASREPTPRYEAFLRMVAARLDLQTVRFEGHRPVEEAAAWFKAADLFVSVAASVEYPLAPIEAMTHGVPVMARNRGGVPDAMGDAGMLFGDAEPRVLAELMHRALADDTLRAEMLGSQERRLAVLRGRDLKEDLRTALADAGAGEALRAGVG